MADQTIEARFNTLYEETSRNVLLYITSKCADPSDIQDIYQETFAEIFSALQKHGAGYIQNDEAFAIRIAKQKLSRHYSLLQKLKSHMPTKLENRDGEPFERSLPAEDISIDDQLVTDALMEEIRLFLREKPAVTRKIFYLYYTMELTLPQIAEQLQMTESNVKNRLYRTLSELRKKYQP